MNKTEYAFDLLEKFDSLTALNMLENTIDVWQMKIDYMKDDLIQIFKGNEVKTQELNDGIIKYEKTLKWYKGVYEILQKNT